jgi:hypothetical protein
VLTWRAGGRVDPYSSRTPVDEPGRIGRCDRKIALEMTSPHDGTSSIFVLANVASAGRSAEFRANAGRAFGSASPLCRSTTILHSCSLKSVLPLGINGNPRRYGQVGAVAPAQRLESFEGRNMFTPIRLMRLGYVIGHAALVTALSVPTASKG